MALALGAHGLGACEMERLVGEHVWIRRSAPARAACGGLAAGARPTSTRAHSRGAHRSLPARVLCCRKDVPRPCGLAAGAARPQIESTRNNAPLPRSPPCQARMAREATRVPPRLACNPLCDGSKLGRADHVVDLEDHLDNLRAHRRQIIRGHDPRRRRQRPKRGQAMKMRRRT